MDGDTYICTRCMTKASCKLRSRIITYNAKSLKCFNCGDWKDTIEVKYLLPIEENDDVR